MAQLERDLELKTVQLTETEIQCTNLVVGQQGLTDGINDLKEDGATKDDTIWELSTIIEHLKERDESQVVEEQAKEQKANITQEKQALVLDAKVKQLEAAAGEKLEA